MSNFAVKADTSHNAELVEVYTSDIFRLADEFIQTELDGKRDRDLLKSEFRNMVFYIHDSIPRVDNNNIELIDSIFNIYIRLCAKCSVLPTLEAFSWLTGIDNATFSDWMNGEYRKLTPEYSKTVKKWKETCKGSLVYDLTQKGGSDINKIFIAKAVYGMAETAPVPAEPIRRLEPLTSSQVVARLGGETEDGETIDG